MSFWDHLWVLADNNRYGTILILEFEARSCMKSWDALGAIVDAGELCADSKVFECLGDMTLRSKAPHRSRSPNFPL